ncbi:MAG: hypothetical protein IPI68_08955 [Chitinophagaceae bacterium]|nr:hypothetical protein [Chitinophagaceae bacterium]MBK9568597.1 hypothetical protein [Chitinophagaceae bacterium]
MKKMLVFFFLCTSFFASAQTETEIRNHYNEINKKITESNELGFEGPLYHNQWVTNKNGRSWPAVGIYSETTDFWYDDDPNHIPASERNPKIVLQKVNINRKASALTTHEEYLYKNGRLIFYYSHEGEEGNEWETRVYFNTKGMFKSSVKANGKELTANELATKDYKDFKPDPVLLMATGKRYQDLFLKSM